MNTATRAASGLWSVICLLVTLSLVGLFIYWVAIQQPPQIAERAYTPAHQTVTPGSIIYFETPMVPSEYIAGVTFRGRLLQGGEVKYSLASPDSVPRDVLERSDAVVAGGAEYPMYALFVPSYVRPGDYVYRVSVTYRLNPFKTRTSELPPINITVQ